MRRTIKRSELYVLVWQKPVTRLAAEFGISDVGLAKACRRNGIPLPPRGHWAKLQAGKPSPQIPLPNPGVDSQITWVATAEEPEQSQARKSQRDRLRRVVEEVRQERLAEPEPRKPRRHALVRATAEYVASIPRLIKRYERLPSYDRFSHSVERPPTMEYGRWHIAAPNGLVFIAAPGSVDSVLALFDQLIRRLSARETTVRRAASDDEAPGPIVLERGTEKLGLTLREGYRRLAKPSGEGLDRDSASYRQWQYLPSGQFTLSVAGTERSLSRQWSGRAEQLETRVDEIVATVVTFLDEQPAKRDARRAEEEARRRAAEEAERRRRIAESRRAQLAKAFEASEAYHRTQRLRDFLAVVERECEQYDAPYDQRARVWLAVVKEELAAAEPFREILSACLTGSDTWRGWPPDWWPADR